MTDKESKIVEKIAEAQVKRNAIFADIESLRADETAADEELATLKSELAEAKKPELRHGDYGLGTNWGADSIDAFVYTDQSRTDKLEQEKAYYANRMGQINVDHAKHSVLGNIFDDLKAVTEPLTGFEVECLSHMGDKISVSIVDNETRPVFEFKYYHKGKSQGNCFVKIPDLILNLRRMQHTLRSKA